MMRLRMLAAAAMGLLVATPGAARAQYVFAPIDVPGAAATYANGNTTHEIVGEFDDQDGNTHGFVLSKGGFTPFDAPGADGYTSINGINDQGDRSGIYFANGRYYGYFWHRGGFNTLDPSGSTFSAALFLNDLGQVVGYSVENKTRHGFVWSHGVFTTIDPPDVGPGGTRAIGINNREQIVGAYSDKGHHIHGFLLSHGVYTPLDVPGSEDGFTFAEGINDAGQVVGYYAGADGTSHGFILNDGVYTPLDVPGSFWTEVYSINARGEIVGAYEDADGVHGFVGMTAHYPPTTTGTE
jgi:probable HAF family extracellular repeat protein